MDQATNDGPRRLPVSLLTGFLGSGKTTVLKHLLAHPAMGMTAVVINEFGEVGLDHELVETSNEDLVLLSSGCLCCTIRGDLVDTLRALFLRRVRGEIPSFERLVIETTGLADPAPILHTLMTDPLLSARFRLDGVIAVVDAASGAATMDRQEEAVKQAAVADRILLTKTDIAPGDAVSSLEWRLRELNPAAPIIRVQDGAVDPWHLFDAGLYDPKTKSLDVQRWLNAEAYSAGDAGHEHGGGHGGHGHHAGHGHAEHGHDVNRHDDHIKAVCLTLDEPIHAGALELWLFMLQQMKGPDLLRMKGIVNVMGARGPVVIHGVQHVFHPSVELKEWPGADRRNRIVFITRDIDEATLRATLRIFTEAGNAPAQTGERPPDPAPIRHLEGSTA
jgi:G3E family GTPase